MTIQLSYALIFYSNTFIIYMRSDSLEASLVSPHSVVISYILHGKRILKINITP